MHEELEFCQRKIDRKNAIEKSLFIEIVDQRVQLQQAAAKLTKASLSLRIVSHILEEVMVLRKQSSDALELVYEITEHLDERMGREPQNISLVGKLLTTAILLVKEQPKVKESEEWKAFEMLCVNESIEKVVMRMVGE